MVKRLLILFLLLQRLFLTYGQDHSKLNLDSLYLLNIAKDYKPSDSLLFLSINITYKLNILNHKENYSIPQKEIDFPSSYYDSIQKIIRITNNTNDQNKVSDSTIALIQVGYWADDSYGSGGSTDLIELFKLNSGHRIDSLIRVDSVSTSGIFYLGVKNQIVKLAINSNYAFVYHKQAKTASALLDYITEYSISNYGLIRRKFEYKNK
jgi:hypothetical protein